MSRNNDYNNHLDEEDDGEELEITDEDEAASDDDGRELAATYLKTGGSIRGSKKWDENHRRMWFRMAIKALAEGRERRSAAEAVEKARVAAAEQAERDRLAHEAKQQRHRERFERSMKESDDRWARLDEQTRQENAAWEAGREESEAAAARSVHTTTARTNASREAPPSSATVTRTGAGQRTAPRPSAPTTLPKPASPTRLTMPSPPQAAASPSWTDQGGFRPLEVRPSGHAPQPASQPWIAPKPLRVEPDRRVAPSPPPQFQQPRSAPTATPTPKRPAPAQVAPPITRASAPVAANEPSRAPASSPRSVLTGADLAAWRSARGLTQRPAADLLGVAPSTVAKAELLPGKALGEQLQVALAAAVAR